MYPPFTINPYLFPSSVVHQRPSWPVHPYMGRAMTLDYADAPNFNIYHGFRLSSWAGERYAMPARWHPSSSAGCCWRRFTGGRAWQSAGL